ncbi:tRNA (guanosine(37)-N1)-methyltransferase TrmD [Acidaminococcus fermentans DSM 20731]|uniref:tRNA (guanine-N(1)-)-methyltransferase n=1 Tax=Acidaminococcus fermentans (strain ATCC 25085 / DSM 20731 / CCUG 9996 / CIP 106432 / VR4) TaxID=591001 RepID=D2RIH2_ACIFV|nr:tRNA (guanosine(37)-N1)-methyltransferase TrmD [Acidaminococcus fermentans]ADB46874.1 tRNA (guanine-N1)-methyltransferase [Acidaminococcus fermentans DSM 20731]UEA72527.1 tRNA (guanosine(37)-N1)-methyltransferase TrmD [Acidaminococcus fermentans DSM 20731]
MKFVFVTLFPEMIRSACEWSILGRAAREGLLSVECVDPRYYATDRHRSVDDTTCGGGAGMVLKPQTFLAALDRARELAPGALVAAMTPVGESLGQERVCDLAGSGRDLILLCGHYEGFDERILEEADLRLSIGDFVLTGGELPALCVMDAVARFIPGVLGKQVSAEEDSFHHSLLEYPQYTRPVAYRGKSVPELLLSGDHAKIGQWRRKESLRATCRYRPELLRSMQWQKGDGKLFLAMKEEEKEKSQRHRED